MLILLQSIGMMSGPVIISLAMQQWGHIAFVLAFSAFSGLFMFYGLKHITFRPAPGYIGSSKTEPIPVSPTHVFPQISQDDTLIDKAKDLFAGKKE